MVNKDFRKWENAQQTSPRALLYDAATYEFIYSFISSWKLRCRVVRQRKHEPDSKAHIEHWQLPINTYKYTFSITYRLVTT